jgi:hypothetical protein
MEDIQPKAQHASMNCATHTRRIGLLGYDAVTALDLVGPMDVFSPAS